MRRSSNDAANSRVRASTLLNKRTFSIAIAAWSANVVTSSICFSVNGSHLSTYQSEDADRSPLPHHRHGKYGAEIA